MIDEQPRLDEPEEIDLNDEPIPAPVASRDDDGADVLPPPSIAGKGPMDQTVPDVVTGSTPVTRRDD